MHQRTSTQHSVRIDHTHKHKMLTYTDVEFPSAELKHLSILPVLLCLLFGMDGGDDVQMLMSPTARLLSRWRPSCWALLKTADRNKNTERSSGVNSLQGCSASWILLIFSENKTHFCSSCSSLGQQTPPEASRFLNSYILYLYHCCASSLKI